MLLSSTYKATYGSNVVRKNGALSGKPSSQDMVILRGHLGDKRSLAETLIDKRLENLLQSG